MKSERSGLFHFNFFLLVCWHELGHECDGTICMCVTNTANLVLARRISVNGSRTASISQLMLVAHRILDRSLTLCKSPKVHPPTSSLFRRSRRMNLTSGVGPTKSPRRKRCASSLRHTLDTSKTVRGGTIGETNRMRGSSFSDIGAYHSREPHKCQS